MSIVVNCHHWKFKGAHRMAGQVVLFGSCDHGDARDPDTGTPFGANPSVGICAQRCQQRQPLDPDLPAAHAGKITPLTVKGKARELPEEKRSVWAGLKRVVAFAEAKLTARRVPLPVVEARAETCRACEHGKDEAGVLACDVCKCPVFNDPDEFQNLAALAENMRQIAGHDPWRVQWGCKHPQRFGPEGRWSGKGWDPALNAAEGDK